MNRRIPTRRMTLRVLTALAICVTAAASVNAQQIMHGGMQAGWPQAGQGGFPMQPVGMPAGPPTYTPHGLPYCGDQGGTLEASGYMVPHALDKLLTTQRYDDHWIDLRVEGMNLKRGSDSLDSILMTTAGVSGTPVLTTGDVRLDSDEWGGRIIGAVDLFSSFDLEMVYWGGFEWSAGATADSGTNSLFSVFSDFGVTPPQGFVETDQATTQSVFYDSDLDNWELNFRWRWSHTTNPITGAWIMGVRYLKLKERFRYTSFASAHIDPVLGGPRGPGELDYVVGTSNDLVGFQIGAELMTSPIQSLLIGVDGKVGIYGNAAKADTDAIATTIPGGLSERNSRNQTAFVGEASVMALYRVVHELYARIGYQGLFVQGLALGPDNFNAASPFTIPRPQVMDSQGHVFYHGFYAGLECQW